MTGPAGLLRRFRPDRRGAVALSAAAVGFGLAASLAVAVDVSRVDLSRQSEQSALDHAALAAARELGSADRAARAALAAHGVAAPDCLTVTLGRYYPDGGADHEGLFVAGGRPVNAVRLDMKNAAPIHFGRSLLGGPIPALKTRSIAANSGIASFTIGTRLAALNAGAAKAILPRELSPSVSLNAMD